MDVLVNNAALVAPTTIDDNIDEWLETWQQTLQINLVALALLCRHGITHFRERGGGMIINMASRASFRGDDPHLMHYAASKGGVVALTRSIARGYARDNVLAYVVAPGFVRTERQEGVIAKRGEEAMVRDIPLGQNGDPRRHRADCCVPRIWTCPPRHRSHHRHQRCILFPLRVLCGRPLRARALMSADAGWPIAVICPARRCGVEAAGLDAVRGSAPNQSLAQ